MNTTTCNLCSLEVKQDEFEIHNKLIHEHNLEWLPVGAQVAPGDSSHEV